MKTSTLKWSVIWSALIFFIVNVSLTALYAGETMFSWFGGETKVLILSIQFFVLLTLGVILAVLFAMEVYLNIEARKENKSWPYKIYVIPDEQRENDERLISYKYDDEKGVCNIYVADVGSGYQRVLNIWALVYLNSPSRCDDESSGYLDQEILESLCKYLRVDYDNYISVINSKIKIRVNKEDL